MYQLKNVLSVLVFIKQDSKLSKSILPQVIKNYITCLCI